MLQQRKQQVQSREVGRGSGCSLTPSDVGFPFDAGLVLGHWAHEGRIVSRATERWWWPRERAFTVGGHGSSGDAV